MNDFLRMTTTAIQRHGLDVTFKKVGLQAYDPSTGSVTSTDVTSTIRVYPKHIKASQWSYPNLIGKDAVMFYLSGSASSIPEVIDSIQYDSKEYKIESIQKHIALGQVCLYKILAVKA